MIMKRINLTLLVCICFFQLLVSQTNVGWNYLAGIPSKPNSTYTIATNPQKDKIVLCSTGFDTLARQCIIYTQFDTFGYLENLQYVVDSAGVRSSTDSWWGGMITTTSGKYLTTTTTKRRNCKLTRLNTKLEVEWIREFYRDTNVVYSNFDMTIKEVSQGYLLYGSYGLNAGGVNGLLRFVDTLGQEVWSKTFDYAPFNERILTVETLNDSIFLIGTVEGLTQNQITVPQVARTGIYQISASTGAIMSEWQSENEPAIGYIRDLKKLDDTTLLVYGPAFRYYFPPVGTTIMTRNMITLMDTDYHIIRQDSFGSIVPIGNHPEVKEWMRANDGSMIAVAGGFDTTAVRLVGRVFKFDPYSLDVQWDTQVSSPLVQSEYDYSQLFDFDTLVSGNIIAVGTAIDTFNTYTWVVKITKEGCVDTLWCNTSSTMHPNMLTEGAQLVVYPNPASDWVQVGWPDAQNNHEAELMIYDALGRIRLQTRVKNLDRINLKFMPSGMYFMLVNRNGNYTTAKLMIDK
jgi:Secretion system C-terminal sorting domain